MISAGISLTLAAPALEIDVPAMAGAGLCGGLQPAVSDVLAFIDLAHRGGSQKSPPLTRRPFGRKKVGREACLNLLRRFFVSWNLHGDPRRFTGGDIRD
jgi:hypothetical protein